MNLLKEFKFSIISQGEKPSVVEKVTAKADKGVEGKKGKDRR